MISQTALYSKIADNIYVGNSAAVKDNALLQKLDVSAVINFGPVVRPQTSEPVVVFDYALSDQELMDNEIPRTLDKLNSITEDMKMLLNESHCIFVTCQDGKNKSLLLIGYYLIKVLKKPFDLVVNCLEYLYSTKEMSDEERREMKGLTMASFRKVLRISAAQKSQ